MRHLFVFLTLLLSAGCLAASSFRVGSLMLPRFGEDPEAEYQRSLLSLANILAETDADLLALQGVVDSELGRAQLERLVSALNQVGASSEWPAYEASVTAISESPELAVFLHRAPVKRLEEPRAAEPSAGESGGSQPLFRVPPAVLRVEVDGSPFDFVSLHLAADPGATDTSAGRAAELSALAQWIEQRERAGEPPVILAGVVNRHLKGKVWERLQYPGHEQWYRLPLMEAMVAEFPDFDPVSDPAPSGAFNTVTNQNRRRVWDNIIVSRGAFDLLPQEPRRGEDVGLVAFDEQPEYLWVTAHHPSTISMLTDHRPIWLELRSAGQ